MECVSASESAKRWGISEKRVQKLCEEKIKFEKFHKGSILIYYNPLLEVATIMIVKDNKGTNNTIFEYIKTAGHILIPVFDGVEALEMFRQEKIDLIVLDIMFPKVSGAAVLYEIRKSSNVPILMLTAVDDEYTQANSFDELADDYITKPFSMFLLGKRITTLLRRSGNKSTLKLLIVNKGLVLSRNQILDDVWGDDCAIIDRTIDITTSKWSKVSKRRFWGVRASSLRH